MRLGKCIFAGLGAAMLALLLWWLLHAPAAPQPTVATSPSVSKPKETPVPLKAPPQVALPTTAPVQVKANPTATAPAVESMAGDPQADLKTAIPDVARLYRTDNLVTLVRVYTPPDNLTLEMIMHQQDVQATFARNPFALKIQQTVDAEMAQAFADLAAQTPTYNAAGDEATYTRTIREEDGKTLTGPVTFIRINNRWYLKPEDNAN